MKRLTVIMPCCNSGPLVEEALEYLHKNSTRDLVEFIIFDNGSDPPLPQYTADRVIRVPENIGGNYYVHRVLPEIHTEFIAYIHDDLMIAEQGWDQRVLAAFDNDPKLALIGFVGSNQMDSAGGRGYGTSLNYQGNDYRTGWTSKAEVHGRRFFGLEPAANLDNVVMIFRRSVLEQIPPCEGNYGPGHYYDRACCLEVISRGYRVGMMGIACDHFSGGIGLGKVEGIPKGLYARDALYKRWLESQGLPTDVPTLDMAVHEASARIFLNKWRHFLPLQVDPNWNYTHRLTYTYIDYKHETK